MTSGSFGGVLLYCGVLVLTKYVLPAVLHEHCLYYGVGLLWVRQAGLYCVLCVVSVCNTDCFDG